MGQKYFSPGDQNTRFSRGKRDVFQIRSNLKTDLENDSERQIRVIG